ncbi:hypothetical protein Q5P01_020807 [Channa striata]|uniref:Uncharacterized protein n=1 Tax=Channa striata TaxID=64152 RepID=A0AA88LY87_CHASR|nr:hypothetical protein Q5P01_020807 [Channa striata]
MSFYVVAPVPARTECGPGGRRRTRESSPELLEVFPNWISDFPSVEADTPNRPDLEFFLLEYAVFSFHATN